MKPKEWLKANGHISEIGRGRLSRDHIALVEGAVREGVSIEGYEVSKATAATPKPTTVDRVKTDQNRVLDVPDEIRAESAYQAYYLNDGKKVYVGMRETCDNCKQSFTFCFCPDTVKTIDEIARPITFTARTTPFVRSW